MFRFFRTAFRMKTLAEWRAELGRKEICFGPVNTLEETFADPQVRHPGDGGGAGRERDAGAADQALRHARLDPHVACPLRRAHGGGTALGLGAAEVARL